MNVSLEFKTKTEFLREIRDEENEDEDSNEGTSINRSRRPSLMAELGAIFSAGVSKIRNSVANRFGSRRGTEIFQSTLPGETLDTDAVRKSAKEINTIFDDK